MVNCSHTYTSLSNLPAQIAIKVVMNTEIGQSLQSRTTCKRVNGKHNLRLNSENYLTEQGTQKGEIKHSQISGDSAKRQTKN